MHVKYFLDVYTKTSVNEMQAGLDRQVGDVALKHVFRLLL